MTRACSTTPTSACMNVSSTATLSSVQLPTAQHSLPGTAPSTSILPENGSLRTRYVGTGSGRLPCSSALIISLSSTSPRQLTTPAPAVASCTCTCPSAHTNRIFLPRVSVRISSPRRRGSPIPYPVCAAIFSLTSRSTKKGSTTPSVRSVAGSTPKIRAVQRNLHRIFNLRGALTLPTTLSGTTSAMQRLTRLSPSSNGTARPYSVCKGAQYSPPSFPMYST